MSEFDVTPLITDHPGAVLLLGLVVLVVVFLLITALIVFTRWVVHSEVTRLTAALHADVMEINAKLGMMVGRKWNDEKIDAMVNDLRSILNLHDKEIETLRRERLRAPVSDSNHL